MGDLENAGKLTRNQWAKCVLIAVGLFGFCHWYYVDSGRFYPIVVWGAPLFGFVGIVGLIHPEVTDIPKITIGVAILGLATGIALHYFLYGF